MSNFIWFEAFPPRGLKLEQVTALVRPLASRPRLGVFGLMPVVVFELWLGHQSARWFIGVEEQLRFSLPKQLQGQLPALDLVPVSAAERPKQQMGCAVRIYSLAYPIRQDTAPAVSAGLLHVAGSLRQSESAVVQWIIGPSFVRREQPERFDLPAALGLAEPQQPDAFERAAWRNKIAEPLFGVRGRIGCAVSTSARATVTLRALTSALHLANGPHARLRASRPSAGVAKHIAGVMGPVRLWSSMLNGSELATLIGWPLDGVTVPSSHAVLPSRPPRRLLLPAGTDQTPVGRILGASLHPADHGRLVGVPARTCLSHLHVVGPTGSGKSNLLAQMVLADVSAGRAALVLEPKGHLIEDLLARLPEQRRNDVVLIEPGDTGPVVGFNPLYGPRTEAERRADELLGLFRELFGSAVGPRSSDVLLHALITAARLKDGTLTDVPMLLTNAGFRRSALSKVGDPLVLAPFWAWFDQLSQAEAGQVVAPVMNKLRVLQSRAAIRHMLGQALPSFDLDELFSKRRIVLVNLNRGMLGPETTKLIGCLLLRQLWQAIQRRAKIPSSKRHPTMVVIDEWQDFTSGLDFGDVLAQARGLNVGLTLAHQHLGQLSTNLRSAVLANARSRIVFRPAQDDTKALTGVLGSDIRPEDLAGLGAYQAVVQLLVDAEVCPAFAVRTLPLPEPNVDFEIIKAASRERYGVDGAEIDKRLRERWQGAAGASDAPVGVSRRPQR